MGDHVESLAEIKVHNIHCSSLIYPARLDLSSYFYFSAHLLSRRTEQNSLKKKPFLASSFPPKRLQQGIQAICVIFIPTLPGLRVL